MTEGRLLASARLISWISAWCGYVFQIATPVTAQTVVEPEVVHLEVLTGLPNTSIPRQGLTVVVRVSVDGTARLDDPDLDPAWVSEVERALGNSRFKPATKDGIPTASRVSVNFRVVEPATERLIDRSASRPRPPVASKREKGENRREEAVYGATARIARSRPDLRRLEADELRDLPGAFGDPFRSLEAMPGVTPYTNALPYVYVRGAPPAGTLYIYDDIALPALFHLGLGPAVIHPAMIGPIVFYSGVGPARYGRRTGGLLTSASRDVAADARETLGEIELRAIDFMGMVHTPLGGGSVTAAGRYGYPGLILSLVSPEIELAYWDYQLRFRHAINNGLRAELVWFGSYDSLSTQRDTEGLLLTFHRLELRLVRERRQWEYGTALLFGYEESKSDASAYQDSEAGVIWSGRVGPRVWLDWKDAKATHLRLGADMIGIIGRITRNEPPPSIAPRGIPVKETSRVPSYVTRTVTVNFEQFNNPLYTWVASRNTTGLYGELGFRPAPSWDVDLGLRGDLWLTGHRSEVGVDPRLLVTHYPLAILDLHLAVGLVHQPAVFLLPIPGVADVALDRGLQEAVQSEFGVGFDLWKEARFEAQMFLHYYTDLLFPELAIERLNQCSVGDFSTNGGDAASNLCQTGQGFPRATAFAYGAEFFLRRSVARSLSGWLSYTLTWSDAKSEQGFSFTPVFDMRHVANLVLQYRPVPGWRLGVRLHARSGKMATILTDDLYRLERRLPGFFRADIQGSYGWNTSWGRVRVTAEWFNLTLAREARSISCGLDITDQNRPAPGETCSVEYGPALFFPNVGVGAEF
ncbi:MAG: TonB-dependent receptor [Deltaproteobacteria bacterium]|nr:TonB-dependent receptor [Deltaproteobacteria bacterium]